MFLLRKIPHQPKNPKPSLTVAARLFNTEIPPLNSFPDKPSAAYYDLLVNAAGESKDYAYLHYLLNKRTKDHCFNTSNTFNFLTNSDASLSSLPDLSKTLARLDKGFTRKSAYDSLVSRLCKLDRVDDALSVVELMAREHFGLNACTFHPILLSLTKKAKMEDAWRVLEMMRIYEAPPDLTSYNYLLMTYCFAGDSESTAGILGTMVEEGMKADPRTYDALVLCACRAGKVDGAVMLLRRMVDDGMSVLLSTHMYVVNSLLNCGFYGEAIKFVRGVSGRDTWLDKEGFGSLAKKLIMLERFSEAEEVLGQMRERGLVIGDRLKQYYESKVRSKNLESVLVKES